MRHDEANRLIADRLKRERLLAGRSLQELARALGVGVDDIRAYERGAVRIPAKLLAAAIQVLGVPLQMLCFDEERRRANDAYQQIEAPIRLAVLRPPSILNHPGFAQVTPIMRVWRQTRGELTDDVDRAVAACGLLRRMILVRQPFRSSRLITQYFGPGIALMRPCETLLITEQPFEDHHADRDFAAWVTAAYAETLWSRRVRVECLRATIRSVAEMALRTRYDRVLIPWQARDGDLYAMALSIQREIPVAVSAII